MNNQSGFATFILSIVIAMGLRIIDYSAFLDSFNPDWVLLVLIYCSLMSPERVGVFSGWAVGMLTDVLTGCLLGQHALVYSLVCYFCVKLHKRIRHDPIPQQSIFIFFILLFSQIIIFWVESIQISNSLPFSFWFPVFSGTLLWPVVYFFLRLVRL